MIVQAAKVPGVAGNDPVLDYLDRHIGMAGTFFKFAKDGRFRKTSDDEEVPEGKEFIVVSDQIQVGWIKYNGKGITPERKMGSLLSGFIPPTREELGDTDQSLWETGLSGKPEDPWKEQMLLPLQDVTTGDLFVFGTTSATGRRAVSNLAKHCRQMQRQEPDLYPVIRLKIGGFQHRDDRIGFVKTPAFAVVGKARKNGRAPVDTSLDTDLNDEVPF